jgi:CopG family nickel-responsive transcriptional regulator
MRFSVAMPESLLMRFDELVARRGIAKNRSEVIRDLVREALVEDECAEPNSKVVGSLTIVYNHHSTDLESKLHDIQHHYLVNVISSIHVHLDADNCLEVIVLRGEASTVKKIADIILGTRGVKNGKLVLTTSGENL